MDESKSSLAVPIIVILAIIAIAGALYYYKPSSDTNQGNTASSTPTLSQLLPSAKGINMSKFRPVDNTDKILGSTNAPIKIVAYTDLECPACKYFHQQLEVIKTTYIDTGKVAVIYRDFPLDSLHSKSRNEFEAAECVNEIGGNDKFWQFMDKIFTITPSNNDLDPALLSSTAKELGINSADFSACVKANKYAAAIQKGVDEAVALGIPGTPFIIAIEPDGNMIPVFGGVPADVLAQAFDLMLGVTSTAPVAPVTASTTGQ